MSEPCRYCSPTARCLICQLGDVSPTRSFEALAERLSRGGHRDGCRRSPSHTHASPKVLPCAQVALHDVRMLLQDAAPHQWPHHRAAVRAWLVRTRPSLVGIGPRRTVGPKGKQAELGDIARVGALMTQLGVDLETELGRRLAAWAMGRGKGWGGDEPKLKNLTLRIGRWMRKLGIVSTGAEAYTIRSYKNAEEDGRTHKYAVRVEKLVDAVIG